MKTLFALLLILNFATAIAADNSSLGVQGDVTCEAKFDDQDGKVPTGDSSTKAASSSTKAKSE